MVQQNPTADMGFWDHIEELRGTIIRSLVAVLAFSIAAFCFKKILFDGIVLAPLYGTFPTYRLLNIPFEMKLINIEVSTQFMVHVRVAMASGLVFSCPYIIYEIWKFIAPALYRREKVSIRKAFALSSMLFYVGVLVGYYLVLPLCLNFFVDYKVSDAVENTIALNSYISLFMSLVLMIGVVFEFPMVAMVLSSMGLIDRPAMRKYRKHAIVVVLSISAIITPADPLSMIILAIPMYLLYEFSILLCRKSVMLTDEEAREEEDDE